MKAAQERITQFSFSVVPGMKKKKKGNEKKPRRWLAVFNKSSLLYLLFVARAQPRLRFHPA